MVKNLRSLIHEYFPLDLRIQFELLSRRRDLVNKEKQEEILKLLRDFNIEGIVPLGPGTNRYAFKINGFVVKVATDHDGKIDNKKEFKMAKRLYPDVTKIYEVSENGTLLVAEYIQPFESYSEMLRYADRIREKLQKISSVYLIGDVGITPNNYANWGLRVGTDDPVCLDFAYVYEVSSELFICKNCKANAMLVPNKDFTKLFCSNPACGKEVLFESIRGRIGNDEHDHEIGDLSKEGYLMTNTNVLTELDESRSNYLSRKKDKKKEEKIVEAEEIKPIIYTRDSDNKLVIKNNLNNKEDKNMSSIMLKTLATKLSGGVVKDGIVLGGTASINNGSSEYLEERETYDSLSNKDMYNAHANDSYHQDDNTETDEDEYEGLAFSGDVVCTEVIERDDATKQNDISTSNPESNNYSEIKPIVKPLRAKATVEINTSKSVSAVAPEKKPETAQKTEEVKSQKKPNKGPNGFDKNFSPRFKEFFGQNLLIISGRVSDQLHADGLYDEVKDNIKDKKMYSETFYKSIKHVVFKSFVTYFHLSSTEGETEDGRSYTKWSLPEDIDLNTDKHHDSLLFVDNLYRNGLKQMNSNFIKVLEKYRSYLNNDELKYGGMARDWEDILRKKLSDGTLKINPLGAGIVASAIVDILIAPTNEEDEIISENPLEGNMNPPEEPEIEESADPQSNNAEDEEVYSQPDPDIQNELDESEETNDEDVYRILSKEEKEKWNEKKNNFSDLSEEEIEEDSESDTSKYISVNVIKESDTNTDIIRIHANDVFGDINIPIYTNLDGINIDQKVPSMVDERNGIYDFLIHLNPDFVFTTKDPEYWLNLCNNNGIYDNTVKMTILERDLEKDEYLMGFYCIDGIYEYSAESEDDSHMYVADLIEDDDKISLINEAICQNIGFSEISYLNRIEVSKSKTCYTDEYVRTLFNDKIEQLGIEDEDIMNSNDDIDEENDDEEVESMEALEDVAASVVLGTNVNAVDDETDEEENHDGVMNVMRRRK